MKTYPVADELTDADKKSLGFSSSERGLSYDADTGRHSKKVRAVATGEHRRPLRGEWYISGSIPEAYRAPNDFSSSYHICRLVRNVALRSSRGSKRRSSK